MFWTLLFSENYSYLCTYDLYGPVRNVFDAGRYITWASGRGLGPGNGVSFGAQKTRVKVQKLKYYSLLMLATRTNYREQNYPHIREEWK